MEIEYTTIKLPTLHYTEKIDLLIANKIFNSRTDAIKDALRDLFEKYPETKLNAVTTEV